MILKELKEMFDKIPNDRILSYGIGKPNSWRGSYDEVMFPVVRNISVGECRANIDYAYLEIFYGYKGGKYTYGPYTPVNFESDTSSYTDGEYREDMIAEIVDREETYDRDKHLVSLMLEAK